jgi:hypothetical protein
MDFVPTIDPSSDDERARIRAEFGHIFKEVEENPIEQSAPRRRGRPPGSRNKPKPQDYAPVSEELPTLSTPPLSTRDQKEVAKRLSGILVGLTGVASTAKPYFQMTEEEAEAISVPLTSYLIRTEATSQIARQVLDEYDVAAFVIALAAYMVRVYRDFRTERELMRESRDRERTAQSTSRQVIPDNPVQTQEGEERPVNREFATASERGWLPSDV